MTEINQKQIGYILVAKDKAILNSEIDAKHFFKTKEEAFLKLKPSIDENPVLLEMIELAMVEGEYFENKDCENMKIIRLYTSLQEICGFIIKLSSIVSKKGLY
jgi:hypothetical protein